ncbi:MAG: ribosomal L7Ae/L30e/S12e/Gadd45 family protein [Clostridia bacterium]|nr:ribosomal L7Ae/L30e/S12e/Gadd45 family protein [Clostridia bacterium]
MNDKVYRYLGLAKRSGNLISGYNTCLHYMGKKKVKLIIISEDAAENTKSKLIQQAARNNIEYMVWGLKDKLSHSVGANNRSVFGITDDNFARVVALEIKNNATRKE